MWFDRVKAALTGKRTSSGRRKALPENRPAGEAERTVTRDAAIAELTQAVAALPDGAKKLSLYLDRGIAYKQLGELDSALANFARVAAVVPALPDVHAYRAECLMGRREYEPAIDSLDRAIALLPAGSQLGVAHAMRGIARAALGDLEAASPT